MASEKQRLIIISAKLFDFEKKSYSIGGYQTYVKDLAHLGVKMGLDTLVMQPGDKEQSCFIDGYEVKSACVKKGFCRSQGQALYDMVKDSGAKIVISTDQLNVKARRPSDVCVQHGIAFDVPMHERSGIFKYPMFLLELLKKNLRCLRNVRRFFYTKNLVCVDYNFYNWLITLAGVVYGRTLTVIPNYAEAKMTPAELDEKLAKTSAPRRIVFARRFVEHRGCLLFLNVLEVLLKKYPDLEVVFAGSGPLQPKIEELASRHENVGLTRYAPDESAEFFAGFDVSIIPTVSSEGTSLTLIESMSAGCYPIASHVGGMTNILLSGYNGRLIYPSEAALLSAIEEVLSMDSAVYKKTVRNAYESATSAFSKSNWEKSWTAVINSL